MDVSVLDKNTKSLAYTKAFEQHNSVVTEAIKSLDELNEQFLQYIYSPTSSDTENKNEIFSAKDQDALKSSMAVMRRLLLDAQVKFRKMVEDNRRLAANIDSLIQSANDNMHELRQELDYTNKRLSELAANTTNSKTNGDMVEKSDWPSNKLSDTENEISRLRDENKKLGIRLKDYKLQIEELQKIALFGQQQQSFSDLKLELLKYQQELLRAKESLQAMKADRKRLKAEKVDLLSQMKQLYGTLEEKESELRDFIRNFEHRMKESDDTLKQLAMEKEECEREKWEMLKRARDATERAVNLKADLDDKETKIQKLQLELEEVKEHVTELQISKKPTFISGKPSMSQSDTGFSSGTELLTPSIEQIPRYTESTPRSSKTDLGDKSNFDMTNNCSFTHSSGSGIDLVVAECIDPMHHVTPRSLDRSREKKKRSSFISMSSGFGSLTRAFNRAKNRRSFAVDSLIDGESLTSSPRVSLLCDDNIQGKIELAAQAEELPFVQWKASHVLAWLEITLNMPRYGPMCAANIKSGKVLVEMSDSELDAALKFTSHMHKCKVRLAIDVLRNPSICKYPTISLMDHVWVAQLFTEDIGLSQYRSVFTEQLIDGRLLNVLSKKYMEKYLNIHRKFHQASILHAVELLRRINFDKEVLIRRRQACENYNCDLIVWTNKRLKQWIETIDLGEYANNLLESGVHGALLVLEPSFNAEAMSVALAIPPSKTYIRRHLTQELGNLVKPARFALDTGLSLPGKKKSATAGGSLGRAFERSYRPAGQVQGGTKKRISFRGSLGRAFGRKTKSELAAMPEERTQSQDDIKIGTSV